MAKIAEAYVEISARLDKMEAGLKDAQSKLGKATTQMQAQANTLTGSIAKVKAAYAAASVFIGGAFVSAITGAIKSTADHLDQLDEMSSKTGVSVEMLTSLELAAKQSSISMEQLAVSIRMMYRSMNEAAGGGKEAAETYKRLGVNVRDSAGNLKSGNEAFLEVADAISKIQNPAEKSAMAMKVFGRAGTEMLPMLEGGKKALKAYIDEAKRLGLVYTAEDAKRGAAFNDMLDSFNATLRKLKETVLAWPMEQMTKIMAMLTGSELPSAVKASVVEKQIDSLNARLQKAHEAVVNARMAYANDETKANLEDLRNALDRKNVIQSEINSKQEELKSLRNQISGANNPPPSPGGGGTTPSPSARKFGATKSGTYNTLGFRGTIRGTPPELIGQFTEIQDTIINTDTEFSKLVDNMQSQWGNTISEFLKGGQTFNEFMANIFEDVLESFANMLGQMAAQWAASQVMSLGASILGSTRTPAGLGVPVSGPTARMAGPTTININAVDAASFEALARRNAGAITSVVWEAQTFGRSM